VKLRVGGVEGDCGAFDGLLAIPAAVPFDPVRSQRYPRPESSSVTRRISCRANLRRCCPVWEPATPMCGTVIGTAGRVDDGGMKTRVLVLGFLIAITVVPVRRPSMILLPALALNRLPLLWR